MYTLLQLEKEGQQKYMNRYTARSGITFKNAIDIDIENHSTRHGHNKCDMTLVGVGYQKHKVSLPKLQVNKAFISWRKLQAPKKFRVWAHIT